MRAVLFAIIAMASVAFGSAALAQQPQDGVPVTSFPERKVGDSCTYKVHIDNQERPLRKVRVAEMTPAGHTYEVVNPQGDVVTKISMTPAGNPFRWVNARTGAVDVAIDPSRPHYIFPLEEKKETASTYKYVVAAGNVSGTMQAKTEIVGWKEITVPAGKFRALEISVRGNYDEITSAGRGTGTYTETLWFSPDLGCNVKYTIRGTNQAGQTGINVVHELVAVEKR